MGSDPSFIGPSSPVMGLSSLPMVLQTVRFPMLSPSSSADAAVIVGGGFAGLFTALALQNQCPGCPIVLIEPRDRFLFQPLLYELLSDELQCWEVAPRYAELLSGTICWIQDRVTRIDRSTKTLTLASGEQLSWSQLVLATGSQSNDFGIPGVKEHSFGFRNLNDVSRLRQRMDALRQQRPSDAGLIIVGAGPTGVELACKLADLLEGAASLQLIERGEEILPGSSAFNRERAQAALEKRAVVVQCNTQVLNVTDTTATLSNNQKVIHGGLIWTAGSKPTIPTMTPESSLINGRISVAEDLRMDCDASIFALGDVSTSEHASWPASAQVAMQQGEATGAAIAALRRNQSPTPFQFQDRGEMLSLGLGDATLTGMGITLAGPLAFQLRRATYLTRLPGRSLGLRSAGAWLLSR